MSNKLTNGNHAKYLSYQLAHERMKAAIEAGFPIEAVAIAESLLTDRFLSFVNFHGAGFDAEKSTLGAVAQKAAKICRETTKDPLGEALATHAHEVAVGGMAPVKDVKSWHRKQIQNSID